MGENTSEGLGALLRAPLSLPGPLPQGAHPDFASPLAVLYLWGDRKGGPGDKNDVAESEGLFFWFLPYQAWAPEGSQLSLPSGNNFQLLHPHVTFLSFPAFWGSRWRFSLEGASAERSPLCFLKIGSWEAETQLSPHHTPSTPLTLGISKSPNVGPPAVVCGIWGGPHKGQAALSVSCLGRTFLPLPLQMSDLGVMGAQGTPAAFWGVLSISPWKGGW